MASNHCQRRSYFSTRVVRDIPAHRKGARVYSTRLQRTLPTTPSATTTEPSGRPDQGGQSGGPGGRGQLRPGPDSSGGHRIHCVLTQVSVCLSLCLSIGSLSSLCTCVQACKHRHACVCAYVHVCLPQPLASVSPPPPLVSVRKAPVEAARLVGVLLR